MKRNYILYAGALAALMFSGCSDNWGIDHEASGEAISHGPMQHDGYYRCELTDAMEVEPQTKVIPQSSDAEVRIWHFQNSQEYICLRKGKAVLSQGATS